MHFDKHENLLLQIAGTKEVLLWHPNASANLYMDHHASDQGFNLRPLPLIPPCQLRKNAATAALLMVAS